ncbi:MAG TPA: hypothetical protein VFF28_06310 [Candidatus Nanoarchaeia archaeon]|nr:hypothetical protein [Candidatus Nanoarchaeia archaeon]
MRHLKPFESFIKEEIVRKISVDTQRAKSLIIESERKMRSINLQLEKIGIVDDNTNDYVEQCFDSLMNLVRAKLYMIGYSASGQGAHEAEVSYLRELGFSEKDVQFADQLRYFRNGILYYGTSLDKEYADKVLEFTKTVHSKLKKFLEG